MGPGAGMIGVGVGVGSVGGVGGQGAGVGLGHVFGGGAGPTGKGICWRVRTTSKTSKKEPLSINKMS